jgi:holo-[acyl-carrier protein] synthase
MTSVLPPGCGIGLDIVEIDRIAKLARRNPRFLTRVFSPQEVKYCRSKKKSWQHFAARFAAKEAVWKALGSEGVALRDISVSRSGDGKPGVLLRGRPAPEIHLSLSHSDQYALAVAFRLPGAKAPRRRS